MHNARIQVEALYLPADGCPGRVYPIALYLALDTTVLWDRYCMIHLSIVCCGRAIEKNAVAGVDMAQRHSRVR